VDQSHQMPPPWLVAVLPLMKLFSRFGLQVLKHPIAPPYVAEFSNIQFLEIMGEQLVSR